MPTTPSNASTKDFVEISQLRGNLAVLKNGSLRSVIDVSSINFDLKSQEEQTAIIQGFQNFLNYVDFPLEILATSRRLDIQPYLKSLESLQTTTTNELLKIQAIEYTKFIKGLTELANIMSKKFYVIVPFYPVENKQASKGIFDTIKSIISPGNFIATLSDQDIQNYRTQMEQRLSVIMGALSSLGLQVKVLEEDQLKNLFFSYYNPGQHL